ncbi:MAG: hypothetical protein P8X93_02350, partial [Gammaproteobacteria bacterium]
MTSASLQTLADSLQARLADMITGLKIANGEISIDVQPDRITEACLVLRDEAEFSFAHTTAEPGCGGILGFPICLAISRIIDT